MIRNPILKVLFTMQAKNVRALLMGGQACIFYGAAEFSRDTDLAVFASPDNLQKLQTALDELQAERIAVPPFEATYLERGHAVHFRCRHADVDGMRIDVLSKMRGVDPFLKLWERRTTATDADGAVYELMSLPDLIQAKKTQRDKDWPMIRRLVEANYFQFRDKPDSAQVHFWFRELRTPELLIELAKTYPEVSEVVASERILLKLAQPGQIEALTKALDEEEKIEKEKDRIYWLPLKAELEKLRHSR